MASVRSGQSILVGEDELEVRGYLAMALKCLGYSVELAQDGDEVLACLRASRSEISAVLLDLMMPNRDGLDTLVEIRRTDPTLPVIVISGASSTIDVVAAMKCGATDFLCKPVAHDDLRKAILRATQSQLADAVVRTKTKVSVTKAFVGGNPRMKEIHSMLGHLGWSGAPILIQGETGTGKEVVARELHALSPRADRPFLKLNCAALPSELVESELFGYERGAFTGAFQKKAGMFEVADGGTILLDEIGDMDFKLQAKLLQVLQDHEFQRIGGKEVVKVNVRVLAATHQDLEKAIAEGRFREDLYYRLNVISLHVPALRECKDDLMAMTEFLIERHLGTSGPAPTITPELEHAMMSYHWPGNVRELENFVRKLIILRDAEMLSRELLTKSNRRTAAVSASGERQMAAIPVANNDDQSPILEQVTKAKQQAEVNAILTALNSTRWNRKRAASLLKIDYKALLYKMKRLGVEDKAQSADAGMEPLSNTVEQSFSEAEIA
jgi:two-component system response regulator AtoC